MGHSKTHSKRKVYSKTILPQEMRKMSREQLKRLMSGFSIDPSISKIEAPEKVL